MRPWKLLVIQKRFSANYSVSFLIRPSHRNQKTQEIMNYMRPWKLVVISKKSAWEEAASNSLRTVNSDIKSAKLNKFDSGNDFDFKKKTIQNLQWSQNSDIQIWQKLTIVNLMCLLLCCWSCWFPPIISRPLVRLLRYRRCRGIRYVTKGGEISQSLEIFHCLDSNHLFRCNLKMQGKEIKQPKEQSHFPWCIPAKGTELKMLFQSKMLFQWWLSRCLKNF